MYIYVFEANYFLSNIEHTFEALINAKLSLLDAT